MSSVDKAIFWPKPLGNRLGTKRWLKTVLQRIHDPVGVQALAARALAHEKKDG